MPEFSEPVFWFSSSSSLFCREKWSYSLVGANISLGKVGLAHLCVLFPPQDNGVVRRPLAVADGAGILPTCVPLAAQEVTCGLCAD